MMAAASAIACACAINFFWQSGMRRAFAMSGVLVCVFILFWASGVWEGASRHSWGVLAPLFALLLGAVWLAAKFLPPFIKLIFKKLNIK